RPVVSLTAAAERVARGEYGRNEHLPHVAVRQDDVVVPLRRNEVARLGESFQHMLGQIHAARSELQTQVSEAHSLAEELERANKQLCDAVRAAEEARRTAEDANAAKSQFLAQMSHELRTPLNAIIGYTELVELEKLSDQQRGYLQRLGASARHLLGLV